MAPVGAACCPVAPVSGEDDVGRPAANWRARASSAKGSNTSSSDSDKGGERTPSKVTRARQGQAVQAVILELRVMLPTLKQLRARHAALLIRNAELREVLGARNGELGSRLL
jgi:hypothetical protein